MRIEWLGPFLPGTPYAADDPALMLWVHAALVETALAVHGRFVADLTSDERESFHREMADVACLFGVPAAVLPGSLAAFRTYFRAQLEGPHIVVTPAAREIASVILEAPPPGQLRLAAPAYRLATAGFLPQRLREEYELRWSRAHEAALAIAAPCLRFAAGPLFLAAEHVAPPRPAFAT